VLPLAKVAKAARRQKSTETPFKVGLTYKGVKAGSLEGSFQPLLGGLHGAGAEVPGHVKAECVTVYHCGVVVLYSSTCNILMYYLWRPPVLCFLKALHHTSLCLLYRMKH